MDYSFIARSIINILLFMLSYFPAILLGSLAGAFVGHSVFVAMMEILRARVPALPVLSFQLAYLGGELIVSVVFLIVIRKRAFPKGWFNSMREISVGEVSLAKKGYLLPRYFAWFFTTGLATHGLAILAVLILKNGPIGMP